MDEAEEKLWRWSGYRRSVSIVADKTDQTDSITGEKLDRIYMKVVQEPKFKTSQEREVYTVNERSTPSFLRSHWFTFHEKKELAIKNIKDKMERYFIQKTEIK